MKVDSESEVTQSCLTLSDPMDCSPPGSSIRGIFRTTVLEWGAIAFSQLSDRGIHSFVQGQSLQLCSESLCWLSSLTLPSTHSFCELSKMVLSLFQIFSYFISKGHHSQYISFSIVSTWTPSLCYFLKLLFPNELRFIFTTKVVKFTGKLFYSVAFPIDYSFLFSSILPWIVWHFAPVSWCFFSDAFIDTSLIYPLFKGLYFPELKSLSSPPSHYILSSFTLYPLLWWPQLHL